VKRPDRRQLTTLGGYAVAAAIYIAIGVTVTDWLLSVFVATAYLLVVAWLVPAIVRWVL
jgi:hypothetical protein